MTNEQYSYVKTGWKAFGALLASYVPGGLAIAALPENPDDFAAQWQFFVAVFTFTVFRAGGNIWKHRATPGNPLFRLNAWVRSHLLTLLPLVALCAYPVFMAGCATTVYTRFSETVVDENGNPSTTEYEVKSRGDVEYTVHEFGYRYGGEENVIGVGQSAVGITSPAQTDALRTLLSLPPDVLRSLVPVGKGE